MASERSCSVTTSDPRVMACHNTTVLSQCLLMLA